MQFLDLSLPTPAGNLALDDALLEQAECGVGAETLRVWESKTKFVVLGYSCRIAEDVNRPVCAKDSIPILRRTSGGGTVVQGPGCLNFSVVLDMRASPALRDIHGSHRLILAKVAGALRPRFPDVAFHLPCDLALGKKKFSGNAQRRRRDWVLHHGTLLYNFPLPLIARYLREPARQPEYRDHRPHEEFVTNLAIDSAALVALLRDAWQAEEIARDWPRELTEQLVAAKFGRADWATRR